MLPVVAGLVILKLFICLNTSSAARVALLLTLADFSYQHWSAPSMLKLV